MSADPAILVCTDQNNRDQIFLVDKGLIFTLRDHEGKSRMYYPAAIDMSDCERAGHIHTARYRFSSLVAHQRVTLTAGDLGFRQVPSPFSCAPPADQKHMTFAASGGIHTIAHIMYPRPKVLQVRGKISWIMADGSRANGDGWREERLSFMKLRNEAACALLELASSYSNVTVDYASGEFTFNDPAIKGVPVGWAEWKFLTAWVWSAWEDLGMRGKQRHSELSKLGYPRTPGALRELCSDMGLVTRRGR